MAQREEVAALFSAAIDHFGHIDVVVANAAFSIRELTVDAEWQNVEAVIGVAQFGVYHTCQMAAQQMIRQQKEGRPGVKSWSPGRF